MVQIHDATKILEQTVQLYTLQRVSSPGSAGVRVATMKIYYTLSLEDAEQSH